MVESMWLLLAAKPAGETDGTGWAIAGYVITTVIAVVALVFAGLSWLESRQARSDVRAYRDAYWTLEYPADPPASTIFNVQLMLTNVGETRATDVVLTFEADPLWTVFMTDESKPLKWEIVDPGEQKLVHVERRNPVSVTADYEVTSFVWRYGTESPGRDRAKVSFTTITGERRHQELRLPASDLPLRALAETWQKANPPAPTVG